MHSVGAANGVGADFRKTDMFDIAGLHHLGDGADLSSIGTAGSSRAGGRCRMIDASRCSE